MAAKKQTLAVLVLNAVLDAVAYTGPAALFVALFKTAPTATGEGLEVDAADYDRLPVTFGAPVPNANGATASNDAAVTFPAAAAAWGDITSIAVCSAVSGTGNQLYYGALTAPKTVAIGDSLNFAVGAISVAES